MSSDEHAIIYDAVAGLSSTDEDLSESVSPMTSTAEDAEEMTIGPDAEEMTIGPDVEEVTIGPDIEEVTIGPDIEEVTIGPDIDEVTIGPSVEEVQIFVNDAFSVDRISIKKAAVRYAEVRVKQRVAAAAAAALLCQRHEDDEDTAIFDVAITKSCLRKPKVTFAESSMKLNASEPYKKVPMIPRPVDTVEISNGGDDDTLIYTTHESTEKEDDHPKLSNFRFFMIGSTTMLLVLCAIAIPLLFTRTEIFGYNEEEATFGHFTLAPATIAPNSSAPSFRPTASPSKDPSKRPVARPSASPSRKPHSRKPTKAPVTDSPSRAPIMPSSFPSEAPSFAPVTLAPVLPAVELNSTLVQQLSGYSLRPNAFYDTTSCEYAAAYWMQFNDTFRPPFLWTVIQRYAVLVSLICMSGDNTPQVANSTVGVCSWKGVTCTNNTVSKLVWANMSLTGSVPPDFGLLSNITYLDLGENRLVGTIPGAIFKLKKLTELYLHQNRFHGTIPDGFAGLVHLKKLFLQENQLSGTFPASLGSNSSSERPLRYLLLSNNNISGTIPANLNLRNMYYLDISYNQMTGSLIPNDWMHTNNAFSLRHYYASNNKFSGRLPANFSTIGYNRLISLLIGNNNMKGNFPSYWQQNRSLEALEIQNNNFTSIPDRICRMGVFYGGALTTLRSNCDICTCRFLCTNGMCSD